MAKLMIDSLPCTNSQHFSHYFGGFYLPLSNMNAYLKAALWLSFAACQSAGQQVQRSNNLGVQPKRRQHFCSRKKFPRLPFLLSSLFSLLSSFFCVCVCVFGASFLPNERKKRPYRHDWGIPKIALAHWLGLKTSAQAVLPYRHDWGIPKIASANWPGLMTSAQAVLLYRHDWGIPKIKPVKLVKKKSGKYKILKKMKIFEKIQKI